MPLAQRSIDNLRGVHPDLVRVVELAAEAAPFLVTEGLRTLERQKMLKKAGKSKTLNSRHLTGHAVDLCDCDGCYDVPDMNAIASAMKAAAAELNVSIEWGGDWKWKDTPHFQLSWKAYPISGVSTATKVVEAVKTKTGVAAGAASAATGASQIPPPPPDLSVWTAWQAFGETAVSLWTWASGRPLLTAALAGYIAVITFAPKLVSRLTALARPA